MITADLPTYVASACASPPLPERETRRLLLITRYAHAHVRRWARNRLIETNMRLVVSRAKRRAFGDVSLHDLCQAGVFGAARAIELYDPNKGSLCNYMTWWIDATIQRYKEKQSTTIRQPSSRRQDYLDLERARHRLAQELGRNPTNEELIDATGLPRQILTALENTSHTLSLDAIVGDDPGNAEWIEMVKGSTNVVETDAEVAELWEAVFAAIEEVSHVSDPRIPYITRRYYILGHTQEEIGEDLGITRQRVSQIILSTVSLLRDCLSESTYVDTWQSCDCRLQRLHKNAS